MESIVKTRFTHNKSNTYIALLFFGFFNLAKPRATFWLCLLTFGRIHVQFLKLYFITLYFIGGYEGIRIKPATNRGQRFVLKEQLKKECAG